MTGAKIAIKANTMTMENPRTPRRLCRRVVHDVRRTRRNRRMRTGPIDSERGGPGSDSNTWIEYPVLDVRDDVAENHEDRDEEENRPREEAVAGEDRDEQVRTESVVREDVLEDDRSANDEAQADRQRRDDRQVRVSSGVPPPHHPFRQAFRLRRQDEILPHDLQHRGLH